MQTGTNKKGKTGKHAQDQLQGALLILCSQRRYITLPHRTPHVHQARAHTHTQSYKSLLDFAPPLKHGHFSLGTTSPCELTHRSVTTHNLVQTPHIFLYIVTLGSDLTTLHKPANQTTPNGEKGKPEAWLNLHQRFCQAIKVIRFCAECKTPFLSGAHVNQPSSQSA